MTETVAIQETNEKEKLELNTKLQELEAKEAENNTLIDTLKQEKETEAQEKAALVLQIQEFETRVNSLQEDNQKISQEKDSTSAEQSEQRENADKEKEATGLRIKELEDQLKQL